MIRYSFIAFSLLAFFFVLVVATQWMAIRRPKSDPDWQDLSEFFAECAAWCLKATLLVYAASYGDWIFNG